MRETIGSAGGHDYVAVVGDVGDGRAVPRAHLCQSFLRGWGVWVAAGAGMVVVEDVFGADENAVVGFGVVAGEVVVVDWWGTSGHGAEWDLWVVDDVCLVSGKDTVLVLWMFWSCVESE